MHRGMGKYSVTGLVLWAMASAAASSSARSGEEKHRALESDHALADALGKSDKTAVSALLDEKFEWTDDQGKGRNRLAALEELAVFANDSEDDKDVKTHPYSQVEIVFGFHHGARFARIWVKRSAGWRAFVFLDTPIPKQPGGAAQALASGGQVGDCENPCRSLPYEPTTETDKAVLAEWQKTKMDEWHPNAEDWASHIAEEFLIINSSSERNKPQRVAIARKQQEAGVGVPGDPIVSMRMEDFGDTVVMTSQHEPCRGGKPYYNVRVFVKRNGHWLIAWSQQTTIQSASPLPAVADRK